MTVGSPTELSEQESPPAASAPDRRRGGGLYFIASLVAQIAALVRYVTLARLLGPEQLGLAATLVVTGSFFDLISDTGSDRFLIQDRHGDREDVQALVQFAWVVRGVVIALCLVTLAVPIANFYKTPKLAAGLACLAISPFILGFTHLDFRRLQRTQNFRPEAVRSLASELVSLVVTAVAAWLTHSFVAILFGLISRSAVLVLTSHLGAERRYKLAWSPEHGPRLANFAMPLMLSGLMLFIGSQGDRVVVARQIGIAALGQYSAVMLLIFYPSAILLRYMHAIYLPMVAAGRDDFAERNRISEKLGGETMLLGVAMAVGFALVAPPLVTILYGARYSQAWLLVGLIGILGATRFLINWPTTVALSLGRSRTVLVSNVMRLFVFPGAYAGYWLFGGLTGVVSGFIAGELISIAASLALLNRNMSRPLWAEFDRFAMFMLFGAAIVGWNWVAQHYSLPLCAGLTIGSVALTGWFVMREWRTLVSAVATAQSLVRSIAERRRRA